MKNSPFKPKSKARFSPQTIGFIASFALHVGLFAVLMFDFSHKNRIESMRSQAFSIGLVNIAGEAMDARQAAPKPKIHKKHHKKPHKKPKKITPYTEQIEEEIAPQIDIPLTENAKDIESDAMGEGDAPHDSTLAQSANLGDRIEILGHDNSMYLTILDIINSHRIYPRMAIVRKIRGDIEVEFILLKSGGVEDIKITSGAHRILNDNAIETIEKTSPKYPKPDRNMRVKLVLSYNLI